MDSGKLRYHGIWAYTLLILTVLIITQGLGRGDIIISFDGLVILLAPIATVITLDLYKHWKDNKTQTPS